MSDDDQNDEGIYKVDTVPPPPGEGDAYNAPTRVGPMAAAVVEEMMHAAERKAAELSQRSEEKKASARQDKPPSVSGKTSAAPKAEPPKRAPAAPAPKPKAPASSSREESAGTAPARVYDDADEEENAATLLSMSAKAPSVQPIPRPPLAAAITSPIAPLPPPAFPGAAGAPSPANVSGAPPAPAPDVRVATPAMGFAPPHPPPRPPASTAPIPFALHHQNTPDQAAAPFTAPFTAPGAGGAFTPPGAAPTLLERPIAVYAALAIGFTLFFIGVALYVWAR